MNRVHTRERDLLTNLDVFPRIVEHTHHERRSRLHDDVTLLDFQHPADPFDAGDAVDGQRLFRVCCKTVSATGLTITSASPGLAL